ncbi:MAG TPA: hypothetical protein DEB05_01845 [Firmicutes bacterium]|jgi:quaternary ammonium compound-resistance protein SugE|nr:hypothetical protein [Bacillota bacterium]
MKWMLLLIAGLFEMAWAISLKYTQGFTRFWPSLFTILGLISSFYFLSLAVRNLPIGTAYAIWTGVGTVGTVLLGVLLFKEPLEIGRMVCIALIIFGVIGLKIASPL